MSSVIEMDKVEVLDNGPVLPVVFHQNPFSNQVQHAVALEGQSIADIVAKAKLPADYQPYLRVWIDDREIAREEWATTFVVTGQHLYVRVVPQKSGKDIFRFIAMLAVVVVAAIVAPYLVPAITQGLGAVGITVGAATALTIAGTLITAVGFLAVNALIPPPKFGGNASQDDPRFDLTSTSNQFSPYGNIARVFGKRRLFPMMAARPYSELQGDDEYLRMALVVGWGPLKIENIKIGETPITAFDGVEYEVREGWSTDSDLTLFTSTVTEENLSVRLEPYQVNNYYGSGAGWNGEYYRYDTETDLYSPFTNDTTNDWVMRTTKVNCSEFSVDLSFPQGLFYFDSKGNKAQATVEVEVQYRAVGSSTWLTPSWANSADEGFGTAGKITTKAADSSAVRRSARFKLPSTGQYEVRVRRTTGNSGAKYVDVVYWTCLRSIQPEYPVLQKNLALIAIRMKATNQLNGVPQTISCEATSYLPVWDGSTWTYQLSSNPAWAYTDLMRRRGGEVYLTDDRLDLTTLKAWADACAATAPNASEPRWTYNDVIEGGSVFDNLRRVAANARAFPVVRDGKHSVVRDIQQSVPVQHITPRNSWGYSGSKAFIDYPHALRVTFTNKDMGYQQDERIVYYDGYTAANATKFETLELSGCTSATQAYREARYHMAVARLRPEEHSVQMDIEALRCTVGDLVRFSHDAIAIGIAASRVTAYTLDGTGKVNTLTFDDDLYFEAGKSYAIRARKSDGSSVLLSLNNPGEGYANTATISTPILPLVAPAVGDLVIFGETTKESAPMIIKKIDPAEDLTCTVFMIDAADAVHTADTGTIPAFNSYLTLPGMPNALNLPPVYISAVRSDDSVVITNPDGSLTYRILVQLQQPESTNTRVDYFEVQSRIATTSAWQTMRVERANGFGYISGVEVGQLYELRSRAVSSDGVPSDWSTSVTHTVLGKTGSPNLPTSLTSTAIAGGIKLDWVNSTSDDFWQVEVYENTTNNSATAYKIAETPANTFTRLGLSPADGVRYYWLKSFNTSGISAAFVGPISNTANPKGIFLTMSNEATTVDAASNGAVSSFAAATGQLKVFDGDVDVTASATLSGAFTVGSGTASVNTADNTPTAAQPKGYYAVTGMGVNTVTYTITAVYAGKTLTKDFVVTKALAGAAGASVPTIDLTNENVSVPAASDGSSPNLSAATTTVSVYSGTSDVSADYTITPSPSAGVTGNYNTSTRVYTVSTLTLDSAYVDFIATRTGYPTLTARFSLSKTKAGSNGAPATVYMVEPSASAVSKAPGGALSPSSITFSAYSVTGTAARSAYAGRFIIATSTDGSTFTDQYTSASNESSYAYTVPAGVIAVRARLYQAGGTTTLVDQETVPVVSDGAAGGPGSNSALVYAYQRATSAPSTPSANVTYTFASGAISGLNNGWSATIPAGTNPLYVTIATASGTGTTDTIAPAEWSSPVVFVQNGVDGSPGAAGLSAASVFLYQRTSTATPPSVATTGSATYTFATGGITGQPSGWTSTVPAAANGGYLWAIQATASSNTATDTIANTEWTAPNLIAQDGAAGNPGASNALIYIYQRGTSAPALPSAATTYTFATGALTGLNNGWTTTIPAGTNPLYVSTATASSSGATDTIAANEWSAATVLSQNGVDGSPGGNGLNVATVFLYRRTTTNSAPSVVTTGSATYTFATGALSGQPTGWTTSVPSASGGGYLWVIQATASNTTTTDSIANTEWSSPVLITQDGTPATTYDVLLNPAAIVQSSGGAFTPSSITVSATSTTGSAAPAAYAGRFIIATSADGTTWTDRYTSASDQSSYSYSIPAGTKYIRARLYTAGGTTTLVDEQAAPVIVDGTNGSPGSSPVVGFLTNEAITFAADPNGTVSSYASGSGTFKVYNGTSDVTTSSSFSVTGQTDCSVGINATTGAYTVNSMSNDTASATLQAVYGGITVTKSLSLSKARAGADGITPITLNVTPSTHTVACDYLGAPKAASLPVQFVVKVTQGVNNILSSATVSITPTGCTASYSSGVITVTALSSNSATIDVTATYQGQTQTARVSVVKLLDAAPATSKYVNLVKTDINYTSSSYQSTGPTLSLNASSSGIIACSAAFNYIINNLQPYVLYGKVQWRVAGGTWADIAAETQGNPSFYNSTDVTTEPGDLYLDPATYTVYGLTPGLNYEFQLLTRKTGTNGGSALTLDGTFTVAQV